MTFDQSHHLLESPQAADIWLDQPGPAWLMKHSNRCPFSIWALEEVMAYLSSHPDQPAALVVVQDHRPVSDHIASRTGIRHETPQMMLVHGGQVVWHASHGQITGSELQKGYEQARGE